MKKIKFLALLMAIIMMFATISIFAEGEAADPAPTEGGTPVEGGDADEDKDTFITLTDDPCYVVDLSKVPENNVKRVFTSWQNTDITKVEDGIMFSSPKDASDPGVFWTIDMMFQLANFPLRTDAKKNHIPFTADEVKAIVFKIRTNAAEEFEMFYQAGDVMEISSDCTFPASYEGSETGEDYEYITFDGEYDEAWTGLINKTFRLDWSREALEGQFLVVSEIAFINNWDNAEHYIKGEPFEFNNPDDETTEPEEETTLTTEAATTTTVAVTTEATTEAPKNNKKSGCKSVVTGAAVLVASITLAGVALSKKH